MPKWLRAWIEIRGVIPRWVRWIWPLVHWCPEWDWLLIVGDGRDYDHCDCGAAAKIRRDKDV